MHSDDFYCGRRSCGKSCRVLCLGLAVASLALSAGLFVLGLHARREIDARVERYADAAAQAYLATALELDGLRARIDSRIAESEKRSHGLRKSLADELRREVEGAIVKVQSDIAAASVKRDQQITSERSQRRKDIEALMDRTANTFGAIGGDLGDIEAKLAVAEKKLAAVEKLWLEHRCPGPAPPAPAKVTPPPVAPLSQVYTIPYPWFYERPQPCLPRR